MSLPSLESVPPKPLSEMNVRKPSLPVILLVIAVKIFSIDCLPEYVDYTLSVVQHMDRSQAGTFQCVFINLNKVGQSDGDVDDLLKSLNSLNIVIYAANGFFKVTYGAVPLKPSLILIYVGDQAMPKAYFKQVNDNFEIFDTNSKVLVIGNLSKLLYITDIFRILATYKFNLVVYLGTVDLKVLRFSYNNKLTAKLYKFPNPENLFEDTTRNIRGNQLNFAVLDQENYEHLEWMLETADFINGILFRNKVNCDDNAGQCMAYAIFSGVDIVMAPMFVQKFNFNSRRWIFEKSPESGVLVVPKGKPFNVLEMFLKPFTVEAWVILFVILCAMKLFQIVWPTVFVNDPILLLVCGLERQNLHHATWRERMIFLPLIMVFFLMTNVYESKLLSFLTEKPSHADFATIHEVFESGLKVKYDHFTKAMLTKHSLLAPFLVNSTDEYLDADGAYAYYRDSNQAESQVRLMINYDFKLRRPKYIVLRERMISRVYAYIVDWKTPLRDVLYYTYQVFWESGILEKWRMHLWDQIASNERAEYRDRILAAAGEIMLGIKDLVPAWFALGVGLVLSGVAFLGELAKAALIKSNMLCWKRNSPTQQSEWFNMRRECW